MEKSFFIQFMDKYLKPLVAKVTEEINGRREEVQYLYKSMLTPEYSPDMKWGSSEINSSVVAADVVALDTPLPLKKRDSITVASGDVPKIGMKLRKGEKAIRDIQTMIATGASDKVLAEKIFDDVAKCIKGIDAMKEFMFLSGLSTGQMLVEDTTGNGIGVRVDYGYKRENTFYSKRPWGTSGQTPQDDIDQVFDKAEADGNRIARVMISRKYFNLFKASPQGKMIAAAHQGLAVADATNVPLPGTAAFAAALQDLYGCEWIIVNSSIRVERHGVQTNVKPWAEANVVFLYDAVVGRLVYSNTAEATNPVAGVVYETGEHGTLISKYSKNDPLEEYTAAQAIALPVIDGVNGIYLCECDKPALRVVAASGSDTFGNTATNTPYVVNVYTDAETITATSGNAWAGVTVDADARTVTVRTTAANTGQSQRTTTITVTDSAGETATFTVKQSAPAGS